MCFEATLQHKTSEERASHMDMLAHREPSDASLIILTNSALLRRVLKMHAIRINNHSCIPHIALYLKNTVHSKLTQAAQHGATSQTKSMLRRSQHSLRKPTTLHGNDSANNRICFTNACKTTHKQKKSSASARQHISLNTKHKAQSKHDQRKVCKGNRASKQLHR